MNIVKISIENIKSRPLYTFLSILMLSLSIALLLGVQQLKSSFQYQMENNLGKIDLVVGAKGSPLQLVLASVLHLDNPTGNISYHEAKVIGGGAMIKLAVPISYGDNYKGFRIVGTTPRFLSLYNAKLQKGRIMQKSMEVVLGNSIAKKLNIKIGDTFVSSHGLVENNIHIHDEKLTVVGILKPTQKVIDRLIVTNLESVWDVHHHENEQATEHHHEEDEHHHEDEQATEHHHEEEKEITSLLLSFKNPTAFFTLPRKINEQTNMQAALPKYELDRLYEFTGVGLQTIAFIGYVILVISGIIIFISLYKMIKERAFDLALLRTYGASSLQLIRMIIYEGFIITFVAFVTGIAMAKVGLYFMFILVDNRFQQNFLNNLGLQEIVQTGILVVVMIILSILLAVYPIMKMNISTILSNEK